MEKVVINGEEYYKAKEVDALIYEHHTYLEARMMFDQVEKALGFKLFKWQKSFILNGAFRRYGDTTARCIKALLEVSGKPLDYTKPTGNRREQIFRDEIRKIQQKLRKQGVNTRTILWTKEEKEQHERYNHVFGEL